MYYLWISIIDINGNIVISNNNNNKFNIEIAYGYNLNVLSIELIGDSNNRYFKNMW